MSPFKHDEQNIIANEVESNKSDNQEKANADTESITNSRSKQIADADEVNEKEINVDSNRK